MKNYCRSIIVESYSLSFSRTAQSPKATNTEIRKRMKKAIIAVKANIPTGPSASPPSPIRIMERKVPKEMQVEIPNASTKPEVILNARLTNSVYGQKYS